ncbi:MAG: glycosyltransferase family 39 protein [Terriglobales bacterium]
MLVTSSKAVSKTWLTRANVVLVVTLMVVIAIATRGISKGEFDYNVDESQHAASGIFYASMLKDLPVAHPVQYAYAYYAQYPALAGVLHYPPLFYAVEGVVFRLLGASVVTARITTLLFALMACTFWFRLVNNILGEWAAALSTVIFALLPSVLLFEKAVMLEIPCLALSVGALYFWYTYLTTERIGTLYWFALLGSGAFLVKQHAIFLVAVCPLTAVLLGQWRLFLNRRVLGPLAIMTVLVGPFYTAVMVLHWHTVAIDVLAPVPGAGQAGSSSHTGSLLFYLRALPEQLGWPLLGLVAVGIVSCRWWSRRPATVFMAGWIVGCYLTFTAIPHKEPRYALYWIPALAYFAVGPLTAKWRVPAVRVAAGALALLVLANSIIVGWRYERPTLSGYAPVARRIVETSKSGVILFEARLPANFIFFLRNLDPDRHYLVLRKALWSVRIVSRYGEEEFAKTPDDVRDVIAKNGIKYVVVSDLPPQVQAETSLLYVLGHDPAFELVDVFPIESNERYWKGKHLFLYRNRLSAPPTSKFLHIRMMTLSHDIVLPWSQFAQVW